MKQNNYLKRTFGDRDSAFRATAGLYFDYSFSGVKFYSYLIQKNSTDGNTPINEGEYYYAFL